MSKKEYFPDQITPIDDWFYDTSIPSLEVMGNVYRLDLEGITTSEKVQTEQIQALIDRVAENGGGTIVVPSGIYTTGALFFKAGVNMYLDRGAVIRGSSDSADYPLIDTRIEGESCKYFAALINADNCNGFTLWGQGTIDGNGVMTWRRLDDRRKWNPGCTNKDEQRPRLVFVSNSEDVTIAGINLQNSHFWTTHIYKCKKVKILDCHIFSPRFPVKASSTDAIDLDVVSDVLIKNCYMEVNDDAVALKGGKGPWADTAPENGSNERIIVEDCQYGLCHGCLTCGSESIHNKNVIIRRIKVDSGFNFLWLKMRPDTPQLYEYILMEDVSGRIRNGLNIHSWSQFYDLKDRKDRPLSYADHVTIRNCKLINDCFFDVEADKSQYELSDFAFENLDVESKDSHFNPEIIDNSRVDNVKIKKSDLGANLDIGEIYSGHGDFVAGQE